MPQPAKQALESHIVELGHTFSFGANGNGAGVYEFSEAAYRGSCPVLDPMFQSFGMVSVREVHKGGMR